MDINKALFITQQLSPYLPSAPLTDNTRLLAQGIMESGVEVRTFMPKYGMINERRNQLHEVIRLSGLNIVIDDNDHPLIIKVATLQPSRMQVYFIDNEDYFGNAGPGKLEIEALPDDNDERVIFFVRGVIETVKKLRWVPQLVQCTGWVTALAPLYLRVMYADDPTVRDSKIVYVLQDDAFEGTLHPRFMEKLKLDGFEEGPLKPFMDSDLDYNALNRLAIDYADAVVVTTAQPDPEILEYAKASGKPLLVCPNDENMKSAFMDFYQQI